MSPPTLRIAAALIQDRQGRVLLVRKRGTTAFMQPGGKLAPGETPRAALVRELHEELGLQVPPSAPIHLGRFHAQAANEPGWLIDADIFHLVVTGPVEAASEIDALAWIDPHAPVTLQLAPLTRDHILPLARTPHLH